MNARVLSHRNAQVAACGHACACRDRATDPSFACPHRKFDVWYGDDGAPIPPVALIKSTGFDGRHLWHRMEALALTNGLTTDELDHVASELPPCCLPSWLEDVKSHPLPSVNQFAWIVDRHNAVNARLRARDLDRPDMTLSQARARWCPP
jgi:hypothetical protein